MIERKVYQCEHCKRYRTRPRIYFSSHDTYLHERRCFYNTDNKTCFTCKYNERKAGGNFCSLHLKDEKENNTYYEKTEYSEACYATKYGGINTVSMQINTNCEKWEWDREVEDLEVKEV